uniref:Uncharacterized protein n=1 Tax=Anopheles maculatus TaxID=74869 RepID=A0A182SG81_9DIPT
MEANGEPVAVDKQPNDDEPKTTYSDDVSIDANVPAKLEEINGEENKPDCADGSKQASTDVETTINSPGAMRSRSGSRNSHTSQQGDGHDRSGSEVSESRSRKSRSTSRQSRRSRSRARSSPSPVRKSLVVASQQYSSARSYTFPVAVPLSLRFAISFPVSIALPISFPI